MTQQTTLNIERPTAYQAPPPPGYFNFQFRIVGRTCRENKKRVPWTPRASVYKYYGFLQPISTTNFYNHFLQPISTTKFLQPMTAACSNASVTLSLTLPLFPAGLRTHRPRPLLLAAAAVCRRCRCWLLSLRAGSARSRCWLGLLALLGRWWLDLTPHTLWHGVPP